MVDNMLDDCLFLRDVLASTREIVNNKVSTNVEIFPLTENRQASITKIADVEPGGYGREQEIAEKVNEFVAYLTELDMAITEMKDLGFQSSEIIEELNKGELNKEDKWGVIYTLGDLIEQGEFNFSDKYDMKDRIESVKNCNETVKQIDKRVSEINDYVIKHKQMPNSKPFDMVEWLGYGIADAINSHTGNGLEWNIKIRNVNIPDEVRGKIKEHELGKVFDAIASQRVVDLGDYILGTYAWAKDWTQEGRSGGWFVIETDFGDIGDMADALNHDIDDSRLDYDIEDDLIDGAFFYSLDYKKHMMDKLDTLKEEADKLIRETNNLRVEIAAAGRMIHKAVEQFSQDMESVEFWEQFYPNEEQGAASKGMEREAALDYVPQDFIDLVEEARGLGMQNSEIHDEVKKAYGGKYDTLIQQIESQMLEKTFNYIDTEKFNALVYSPPLPDILGPLDQVAIQDDLGTFEEIARDRFEDVVESNIEAWESEDDKKEIGIIKMLEEVHVSGIGTVANWCEEEYPKDEVIRILVENELILSGDETPYTGTNYKEFIKHIFDHNELDWDGMDEVISQIWDDVRTNSWDNWSEGKELTEVITEDTWPGDTHPEWVGEKEVDIYELLSSLRNNLDWAWWRTRWTLPEIKKNLKSYILEKPLTQMQITTIPVEGDILN